MNTLNQNTVIPTIVDGCGYHVVISGEHVHLVRSDVEGSLGGFMPAEARRLAALLLGAASELNDEGTKNDFQGLIDLIRRKDAELAGLQSFEDPQKH